MAATSELEQSHLYLDLWAQAQDGTPEFAPHSVYQLITSEISQMGKTSFALRQAEVILEMLKGRRFDYKANTHFEYAAFMERRPQLSEWDHQVADEPQRIAGNRDFWSVQNKTFAEELQTNNYRHIHAHLPTPHSHVVDTSVYNICTSHAVITSVGHATIYAIKRRQLERQWDPMTPKLCYVTFEKPSFWAGFCRMRDDYNEARHIRNLESAKAAQKEMDRVPTVETVEEVMEKIFENPQKYINARGEIAPSKVQLAYPPSFPYNRIQQAAKRATQRLKEKAELEKAETEAS